MNKYSHSKRPEGEESEAAFTRPQSYGKLLSADDIIASEEKAGSGGEKAALHIRDHYSGAAQTYPIPKKDEDSHYKCLKHFGGPRLNGSANYL